MIQRIQSLYLVLALLGLLILSIGKDVFTATYSIEKQFELTSHANTFGVQKDLVLKAELSDANLHLLRTSLDQKELEENMEQVKTKRFPFYIFTAIVLLVGVLTVINYKNLKRQQSLARLFFVLNLLLFVAIVFFYNGVLKDAVSAAEGVNIVTQLGTGFYGVCIATAFSFMAMLGVKRDLKLIKSIDRIR